MMAGSPQLLQVWLLWPESVFSVAQSRKTLLLGGVSVQ